MKSHDRCVGADDAEYVYRVTLKPVAVNPGGMFLNVFDSWNKKYLEFKPYEEERSKENCLTKDTQKKLKNIFACRFSDHDIISLHVMKT